jgi:hypothetical protein
MKTEPQNESQNPLSTTEELKQRYSAMLQEKIDGGLDPLSAWVVTSKQAQRDLGEGAVLDSLRELLTRERDLRMQDYSCAGISTRTPTIQKNEH